VADASNNRHRRSGGRPPKFSEPRRPVTVTLPQRTLDLLQGISADRAKAIVKAVDAVMRTTEPAGRVEVVEMSDGVGLLVMPFHQGLQDLPWLTMIEIAPGRFLLTIESDTPIERIEVAIGDMLLKAEGAPPHETAILHELLGRLGALRRHAKIRKAEVLCITTSDDAAAV
jgi:hypothetical protein